MSNDYSDIINLPHHISEKRQQMDRINRAAQFAPFAALTGHDAAILETARLTDKKIELDEGEKSVLNEKLKILLSSDNLPEVTVTYFEPDCKKSGGTYKQKNGKIKKFNQYNKSVIFTDDFEILIEEIYNIESDIFDIYGFY